MTRPRRFRLPLVTVLVTVLFLSLAALATGKPGNPPGNPNPGNPAKPAKPTPATSASPAAAQYGKVRVAICHKGKTIRVAQPAVSAHLRHGDSLGACP